MTQTQQLAAAMAFALLAAACSGNTTITPATSSVPATTGAGSTASGSESSTTAAGGTSASSAGQTATRIERGTCASTDGAVALDDSARVELVRIHDEAGLTIDAALYPHPEYQGNPWSQWGQGIVAPTGRYYSAIGDHLGPNGNSFIYEYDPATNALVLVADVLGSTAHTEGAWGYGKVHAQMALGPCDEIFFATYWGSRRGLTYSNGYEGDLLFHIDPFDRTLVGHGVMAVERGIPTMAAAPDHGLLYAIAVTPDTNQGTFLAIDAATTDVVFSAEAGAGFRSIGVDADGAAYFSSSEGQLSVYDPIANAISVTLSAPGSFIRAADTSSDGSVVAISQNPEAIYRLDADGGLTELGQAAGYTTSIALGPSESEFYYLPDAHGGAARSGAILRGVDVVTGAERDVVALADVVAEQLGVTVGGTYNVAVDRQAGRIYLGLNVDPDGAGTGFGEVALLVIGLP